jgi:RNA-dependent RNA polymerase
MAVNSTINLMHHPRYAFFGFTENQMKEGKVLFFEEDDEWTVSSLKEEFGELDTVYLEHGYGKYSARLGLSFSSTVPSLNVSPCSIIFRMC